MNTLILKIRGLVNYLLRMIIQYPRIFDSDFHELSPDKRTGGTPKTAKVLKSL